ncbi:hypothetical protein ACFPM7_05435 [Actinokineospora guangxiensis]|uniref:Uncharacterized protein n=1 Tax=Actinokineospora guangxiensis TaxID=1490288 RepID=A0ABW0EJZ8_9PSEU
MPVDNVIALIGVQIAFGLVMLVVLWPTPRAATNLLARWGVGDPTAAERAEALTYLRRRRLWYPWLFIGLPAALTAVGVLTTDDQNHSSWSIPATLLIGGLLAELFAQRRAPAPVRTAVPVRRKPTDLVPLWALIAHATTAIATVVTLGSAAAGVAWARWWYEFWPERSVWIALIAAPLSAVAVWALVGLAVRRPPVAELRIDPVLRARSARVPVGLGTAVLCVPLAGTQSPSPFIMVAGLFIWVAVANPSSRGVRV